MLDLEPGIHLDEVELAVLIEELDRAGARIFELAHGGGADFADFGALIGGNGRGVGFFPDLLVAPLQRTVAGAQVNRIALAVAHHLHFDVPGLGEVLLHIDGVVGEGGLGLRAGGRPGVEQVELAVRDLHAAPAAAGSGLDEDGIADLGGRALGLGFGRDLAPGAGDHGDAQFNRGLLGGDLVAHDRDVMLGRADEGDLVLGQDAGKARVLAEEPVAGMDGVGARDLAGGKDRGDVEVGVAGRGRPDAHAFVGEAHMHGIAVGGRVDGDRLDAELLAGAQHAERDLAPVRDQDLVEHLIR